METITCPVCLDDLNCGFIKLICNHHIGLTCFLRMFVGNDYKCPVCRLPYYQNEDDENEEEEDMEDTINNIEERVEDLHEVINNNNNENINMNGILDYLSTTSIRNIRVITESILNKFTRFSNNNSNHLVVIIIALILVISFK